MIPISITDSDMIILQSVESYLNSIGMKSSINQSPQEKLFLMQQAKNYLYSEIVRRFPRVAAYILHADMEKDNIAQGLNLSLSKHVMDPVFINLLMQYLAKDNNAEANCVCGAYLARIMSKWLDQNVEVSDKKKVDKKDKTEATSTESGKDPKEPVAHIHWAITQLLGNITAIISTRYGDTLSEDQILAIAACLAMNNDNTIKELLYCDYPITADVLDVIRQPEAFIKSAILLKKDDLPGKPSANQQAFLDSLKRWTYKKLNDVPTQVSYQKLVEFYGVIPAKVEKNFINPRECGNSYPNLTMVADQVIYK